MIKQIFFFFFLVITVSVYAQKNQNKDSNEKENYVLSHKASAYLDKEKKQPVYTEVHKAYFEQGVLKKSTNDYFDLKGQKIAELNSDYEKSLVMPTYLFRDILSKEEEGLRFENGRYVIFRKKDGEKEETNALKETENIFSCQGWHYYLISQLTAIKDKPILMKLIFPSRLDFYSFRVRLSEVDNHLLKLRLEFDSWVMRLFAPYLDIVYDRETKRLVYYYGPSNISNKEGEVQNVHIFYE